MEKATYTNTAGSTGLKTVWTDPDFDASLHAFYYARVLEIPTPRWTFIQAVKAGVPPPDVVPLTGQEHAWSAVTESVKKSGAGAESVQNQRWLRPRQ